MRTILLTNNPSSFQLVYNQRSMERMKAVAELDPQRYTSEYVLSHPSDFSDVENIFSTWGMPSFTVAQIKEIFPALKRLFYAAGSVQSFARPFLACGVEVYSAWGANGTSVAEYTVAQIVLACKGFFTLSSLVKQKARGEADRIKRSFPGVYGERVGLIGCGMIGSIVAEMLGQYSMEILVFDPFLSDERAERLGVRKAALEEIFSTCGVVSNHLANKKETVGLLRYEHFSAMRPYSSFINTGRGAQVVEGDLVRVLTERPDITAVLDVTWPEPAEYSHPFYDLPNCVLTPHIAGSVHPSDQVRMVEYMIEEYQNCVNGRPCRFQITEKMLETLA